MDRRLTQVSWARTFTKKQSDAFLSPAFDSFLREQQGRLLLVGLDGAYCVDATARGALNRGYRVTLFPAAISTESGKNIEKTGSRLA